MDEDGDGRVGEHRPSDRDRDRPDPGELAALAVDHVAGVEGAGADVDAHVDRATRPVRDQRDERVVHERGARHPVAGRSGGAEEAVGLGVERGEHLRGSRR